MKIWLVGGGTAGHVLPLITLAAKLNSHEVWIATDHLRSIRKLVPAEQPSYWFWGGKYRRYRGRSVLSAVIDIKTWLLNLRDLVLVVMGTLQALWRLALGRPDRVLLYGGYVTVPVGLVCRWLKIPYVIHESDAAFGLANRLLAGGAETIALGWGSGELLSSYPHAVVTGIPLSPAFTENNASETDTEADINTTTSTGGYILILGGSLGARQLNDFAIDQAGILCQRQKVVLITGQRDFERVNARYQSELDDDTVKQRYELRPFVEPTTMPAVMRGARLVVSRAGATTLAELAILHKPSVLIPGSHLPGGHQTENARLLQSSGAAVVVSDQDLQASAHKVAEQISALAADTERCNHLAASIAKFARADSLDVLAEILTGKE